MKLACEALVQGTYSTWLSLLAKLTTENIRFSGLDGGVRFIAASETVCQGVALLEPKREVCRENCRQKGYLSITKLADGCRVFRGTALYCGTSRSTTSVGKRSGVP